MIEQGIVRVTAPEHVKSGHMHALALEIRAFMVRKNLVRGEWKFHVKWPS